VDDIEDEAKDDENKVEDDEVVVLLFTEGDNEDETVPENVSGIGQCRLRHLLDAIVELSELELEKAVVGEASAAVT
jgi:hypothetical protein